MQDIEGLIDSRNSLLWETLNRKHNIEIKKEHQVDYSIFSQNNKTTIFIPNNNLDPASFTHELLHIELMLEQINITPCLILSLQNEPDLLKIFSQELIYHVGNCLEHLKIFPRFIKLGYDEAEFLLDYYENKLTNQEIQNIKNNFYTIINFQKNYNAAAIDYFIGKFFSAKACPNKSFRYTEQLIKLEEIDNRLFIVLQTFFKQWESYDYTRKTVGVDYRSFVFEFVDNMKNWISGKKVYLKNC